MPDKKQECVIINKKDVNIIGKALEEYWGQEYHHGYTIDEINDTRTRLKKIKEKMEENMANKLDTRLSPREELRALMVERNIRELESLVHNCDPLVLRNAYVIGRIITTPKEEEEIRKLAMLYNADCQCSKRSYEVEHIHRLIKEFPKPKKSLIEKFA